MRGNECLSKAGGSGKEEEGMCQETSHRLTEQVDGLIRCEKSGRGRGQGNTNDV